MVTAAKNIDFSEMLAPLVDADGVYIGLTGNHKDGDIASNYAAMLSDSLCDVKGKTTGFVYTDASLVPDGQQCIAVTAEEILRAYFFIPELEIVVIQFLSNAETLSETNSFVLDKVNLARAIGAVAQGGFVHLDPTEHAEAAERYYWQDKLFEAFYHSVAARLSGASVNDYFFAEIDCLFSFGFLPQVDQYLKWYQKSNRHLLYRAEYARWLSICGKAEAATNWIDELLNDSDFAFQAFYVRGLLRYKQQIFDEAIADFEACLDKLEFHYEARLGLGIALRNEGLKNNDSAILKQAASHLLTVAKAAGYHAPEALAHLGALMLSFRNWEKAETFLRKSLRLRENPVTRGFLEQAIAAQQ